MNKIDVEIKTSKINIDLIQRGIPGEQGPPGPANTVGINISYVTVDLSPFKTIIDDNIGATLITAHSEPISPQFTHTIAANEIPSSGDVKDYMAIITIGGQNTDVSDDNISMQLTRNGVNIGTTGSGYSPAGLYWYVASALSSNALAEGDVLGIKFWTDASNLINFAYATIYILPRLLSVPVGFQTSSNGEAYVQGNIDGAIPGVTYRTADIIRLGYYDSVLDQGITGFVSGGTPAISTYGVPIQGAHAVRSVFGDDQPSVAYNVNASPSLFRIADGSLFKIIQNYNFTAGNTLALPNPAGNEGRILQVVNGVWTAV